MWSSLYVRPGLKWKPFDDLMPPNYSYCIIIFSSTVPYLGVLPEATTLILYQVLFVVVELSAADNWVIDQTPGARCRTQGSSTQVYSCQWTCRAKERAYIIKCLVCQVGWVAPRIEIIMLFYHIIIFFKHIMVFSHSKSILTAVLINPEKQTSIQNLIFFFPIFWSVSHGHLCWLC